MNPIFATGMAGCTGICQPLAHSVPEVSAAAGTSTSAMLPIIAGFIIIMAIMEYQKGRSNDGISEETLPPADG